MSGALFRPKYLHRYMQQIHPEIGLITGLPSWPLPVRTFDPNTCLTPVHTRLHPPSRIHEPTTRNRLINSQRCEIPNPRISHRISGLVRFPSNPSTCGDEPIAPHALPVHGELQHQRTFGSACLRHTSHFVSSKLLREKSAMLLCILWG